MPTFERFAFVFMLAGSVAMGSPARALDGSQTPAQEKLPLAQFATPGEALRRGLEFYRGGDAKSSLEPLEYAAAQGQPLAQWKLGRMYAIGDGVVQDDLKALAYFDKIVASYDEDAWDGRNAGVLSSAFVAVGVYNLSGIAHTAVKPDADRAFEMFSTAATVFRDADAQYNLARMYLDGVSVQKDVLQGARWLRLAADKNHFQAQALLGHLLFTGQGGLQRQRAQGLALLIQARDAADPQRDAWVIELYDKAMAGASDDDRARARRVLEAHIGAVRRETPNGEAMAR